MKAGEDTFSPLARPRLSPQMRASLNKLQQRKVRGNYPGRWLSGAH